MTNQDRAFSTEVELRLTGLMTSPSLEVAKTKLGQYLQEAWQLRQRNQLSEALVIILVWAEYYWRKHQPTRSAGLLLEASDLLYLLENLQASQQVLITALNLGGQASLKNWWELEIMANVFLLMTSLLLKENPGELFKQIRDLRSSVPTRIKLRLSREDGYRIAIALRQAFRRRSFEPIDALDTRHTLRSRSEYATLHEYLMAHAERYVIIRDGLTALQRLAQLED